tara:strand:- start:171 stop:686 length:516 start_codon:yes stop_codon:yes gene_type:complete
MKNLDRYTAKGQEFINKERQTASLVENHFGVKLDFSSFDAEKFDAYIYADENIIAGICEIKTRIYWNRKQGTKFSFEKLKQNGYMITAEKLDILQEQSRTYNVYSYIFVNSPNDKKIFCFKVCDKQGNSLVKYDTRETWSRYSCNDYKGDVKRPNAYIPVTNNPHFKFFNY